MWLYYKYSYQTLPQNRLKDKLLEQTLSRKGLKRQQTGLLFEWSSDWLNDPLRRGDRGTGSGSAWETEHAPSRSDTSECVSQWHQVRIMSHCSDPAERGDVASCKTTDFHWFKIWRFIWRRFDDSILIGFWFILKDRIPWPKINQGDGVAGAYPG